MISSFSDEKKKRNRKCNRDHMTQTLKAKISYLLLRFRELHK
jgi:hypothetical protein